jgi:hypothetical protein
VIMFEGFKCAFNTQKACLNKKKKKKNLICKKIKRAFKGLRSIKMTKKKKKDKNLKMKPLFKSFFFFLT